MQFDIGAKSLKVSESFLSRRFDDPYVRETGRLGLYPGELARMKCSANRTLNLTIKVARNVALLNW